MAEKICESCGSRDFREDGGFLICNSCGRKYPNVSANGIDLKKDVELLLQKCKSDPERAERYAKRILEIDPQNPEALRIVSEHLKKPTQPQSSGCYIATAVYGSYDCPQVWTLRRYRDDTLSKTWYGRAFIRTYYAVSPTLVKWFGDAEWFRQLWKPGLDKMVRRLNGNGVKNTPYRDRQW